MREHPVLSKDIPMLTNSDSGNALTDFFFRDTGINQSQFNIGQQLLSVGIVVLEVFALTPLACVVN
jgi:hypothetical protein